MHGRDRSELTLVLPDALRRADTLACTGPAATAMTDRQPS
jgi:hypothetical protein